ncbi:hypothetical protein LVB87_08110 [Lysobacter sp. KIS68-7]|uniref:hypothetical protein n=1 Tax=Lysobacter sp. KIS68-7 TaxID=2904252 RepID=UPI001E5CED7F|nr:hypothetical protein [Lysobacter sp. KIS68-7]UHQ18196.1 hypothetical protein LVB87_08110 [Lysobacter sp. KIS68-7]
MGRRYSGSRGGRARWVALAGLVLVGSLVYLVHQQARVMVGRSLNVVFDNADTESGAVWVDFNGDIVAKDVALYVEGSADAPAPAGADANVLRFERLRIHTQDGWMFFARNLLDRRLDTADVGELQLTFDGFDTDSGLEPTLGTLGPIGALSASPFESEGCMAHAKFTREDLAQMGLDLEPTSLQIALHEADSRVDTRIVLNTPGSSRLQFDRQETLAKETSLLQLPETASSTVSERWDVSDRGFVAARNAFCAKQDGVDPHAFVARHLAAVQRLLEARGLAVDPATAMDYADFAEKGGQIAFGGAYTAPLHSTERAAARKNGSAMLRLAAKLEHGGRNTPIQWRGTQPRPLEALGGATFAAMAKENGGIAPSSAPVLVPTAIDASVESEATDVANIAPAPAAAAPEHPQYASSLPAAPQAQMAPGGRIDWEELPRYEGHILQLITMHGPPRTATLLSVDGGVALVRAPMEGGHADFRISREAFVKATLIQ